MLCLRSNPFRFIPFLSVFLFFSFASTLGASQTFDPLHFSSVTGVRVEKAELGGLVPWETWRRSLADTAVQNSSLILAEERTRRKDPLDGFTRYNGGWNISNSHYWASVGFTAAPFFVIAGIWFVVFGLSLSLICLCYCCCAREPYGYSRTAYALSLILLILFTIAAIVGCIVLYTGQGKLHDSTTNTLDYVVHQADVTVENLRNVSDYLAAAKRIGVDAVFLPTDVQNNIDQIQTKISSSANTLSNKTEENSKEIQNGLDSMRLALIIVAAVMLFLAFLGFLFSVFGLQALVYILVVVGWILVTGTFILCGVFLLLHNVVADTCVSMDEWVQNPTAHTALDDILPCVDNATAQETLLRSRDVTYQLVNVVNKVINNVANLNIPPNGSPLYFNQSGPPLPALCNPFNSNLSKRQCEAGEVELHNATQVWKNYVCEVNSAGICATTGRLTPTFYSQMEAAVNVSYGLYRYGPFLVDLQDCTFVRETFTDISKTYCPGLRRHSQWIYIGLVMVSAAVMLSLIFWVIYARERRHRVYTKQFDARAAGGDPDKAA
ncbi:plasma membrane fusion protein [Trema orientale]|uniref:Plasma membrane fusion protein n=1 Tax=Trema orientale TaxID=63057 RepID=A0A2P5DX33_TREOI|nr:plasma membrane fusion protein [Trema orientale]